MGAQKPIHGSEAHVPGLPAGTPDDAAPHPAWEQIENGRYMPRRIRGSYLGRELG
jgi:hypothetical protein